MGVCKDCGIEVKGTFLRCFKCNQAFKLNPVEKQIEIKDVVPAFKPSKYQQSIYEWVKDGEGNAIVQAVAGSGKTTTILECGKLISKDAKSIFVAFNTAIAKELQTRLPSNIQARTLHSAGLSMFMANTNIRPKVEADKLKIIVKRVLNDRGLYFEDNDKKFGGLCGTLYKIVPLCKSFNINYRDWGEVNDVNLKMNLNCDLNDDLFGMIIEVLDLCKNSIDVIDFDDMIWIPIINDFKTSTYDWVFVDETQDLNKVQFELVKKLCNKNTRIIAVGDRRQSIYAFRGADITSMDNFKDHFSATELPLSICYRCPKSHIKLAKEIVPEIETFEQAQEGKVEEVCREKAEEIAEDGDLILCRTNAPLIQMAFALIRADKKAVIRGRDIGKNLLKMINKYKATNLENLVEKIQKFKDLQNEKLVLIKQGKMDRRLKNTFLTNIDCCDTIFAIADNVESIQGIKDKIQEIFTDQIGGIVCSSVHKAKGLEANRIFILNHDLMPHPMAETAEELEQEYNIKYVALTRSKNEMYLIPTQEEDE